MIIYADGSLRLHEGKPRIIKIGRVKVTDSGHYIIEGWGISVDGANEGYSPAELLVIQYSQENLRKRFWTPWTIKGIMTRMRVWWLRVHLPDWAVQ